ncbi:MAG: type II toxin-antitoxin system HicA family toxin [Deltaproteobacteria bacterium]|nr:type II toxin-antitoxin system HicA family toxin [Deltaproteobacteria bacterium]
MPKLPRAGWVENHVEGSHHILTKEGSQVHLSIPVHAGRNLGVGLLRKLIDKAGLTQKDYCAYFKGKRKEVSLREVCIPQEHGATFSPHILMTGRGVMRAHAELLELIGQQDRKPQKICENNS